jgi:DNA-directed RNA polymerase subunit RPC12/RpoP
MARYQCRACGFDGQGTWHGALVCPRCGSRTAVRVALATAERTDAELAAIAAAVPGGEDLAEDG